MNSLEIRSFLERDLYAKNIFQDVLPSDRLPARFDSTSPSAFVINTDPASRPGEHWVAVYFNGHGVGEYFDPFGFPPYKRNIVQFLRRNCRAYRINSRVLQYSLSRACGLFCIYYVLQKSRGKSLQRLLSVFNTQRLLLNDRKVHRAVRSLLRSSLRHR